VNAIARSRRWAGPIVGALGVGVAIGLVWIWARHMMASKPTTTRQVPQLVTLIRPPPPVEAPPPPPPEKIAEPLPQDPPDQEQAADNAAQQLGLDADASAGSDAFGLASRKGGADLLGTGTAVFGRYTSLLKDAIQSTLSESDKVRSGNYSVVVRVWVGSDGSISRATLAQSSGKRELDAAIEQALAHPTRLAEAPPVEMPQPITLKIVSRG
jgi:protein TonB